MATPSAASSRLFGVPEREGGSGITQNSSGVQQGDWGSAPSKNADMADDGGMKAMEESFREFWCVSCPARFQRRTALRAF